MAQLTPARLAQLRPDLVAHVAPDYAMCVGRRVCSMDIVYRNKRGLHVINLKLTVAKDLDTFLADCEKYEYERQAAFYLDGTGAETVTIYGIQKRPSYKVFRKRYTKRELERGRQMYGVILEKVAGIGVTSGLSSDLKFN